jgi:DNA invertase Pin-like site-specific DNA recombinase
MQEKTRAFRAVGYRRVSMREQVDGYSLDAQENSITKYVREQGWKLINIYEDAGISAKKGSHRPAFETLLADAKEKKFDVVVVDKVDRFYRHLNGLLTTLDQLNSYGVAFASVQERMDFTTPWGKLMLSVLGTLAEIYIDNLRQETRKGKLQRARQGLWLGAIPYGYCNGLCSTCTDPNGKDYCPDFGQPDKINDKGMVEHPIEGQIIRKIFYWYIHEEETNSTIAEKLNKMEVTLPDGKLVPIRQKGAPGRTEPRPFSRDVIRDILNRIAYTGKIAYQGVDENGVHRKRSKPSLLFDGKHPALITMKTFEEAKEIRKLRLGNNFAKKGKPVRIYPLTGTLRCGFCGGPMRGTSSGERLYYADGNQRERICECPQPILNAQKIERQIIIWIQKVLDQAILDDERQSMEDIAEFEKRFKRAKKLYLLGEMDDETFDNEKMHLEKMKKDLPYKILHSKIQFGDSIKNQVQCWSELSQLKRKRLFRRLIETAYVRGNAFVAAQPTMAFQLLTQFQSQELRPCNSGEGGIRTHGRV